MTEDEKARFLEIYRSDKKTCDEIRSYMEAKGYFRDMEREEERHKLDELLRDHGIGMGQASAEVESYGLEFFEENGEVYLREIPPEVLAEREKQEKRAMEERQKRVLAPDDFDDDLWFLN